LEAGSIDAAQHSFNEVVGKALGGMAGAAVKGGITKSYGPLTLITGIGAGLIEAGTHHLLGSGADPVGGPISSTEDVFGKMIPTVGHVCVCDADRAQEMFAEHTREALSRAAGDAAATPAENYNERLLERRHHEKEQQREHQSLDVTPQH
jgi:hypothetical protein